jgi:uncharacterized integral membrane protein
LVLRRALDSNDDQDAPAMPPMIRKIVTTILLVLIAIVAVLLAVANRQTVTVALDPFDQADPALVVALPLYQLILVALIGGVLVGGCAAWLRQSKWRRRARRLEAELRALRAQANERGLALGPAARLGPPADAPRLTIPPSAA